MEGFISTHQWFEQMAAEAPLAMVFRGEGRRAWSRWHRAWFSKLGELMGPSLGPVDLEWKVLQSSDLGDHIREKLVYRTDRHSIVPAYLLRPKGLDPGETRPGVVCAHGHVALNKGKEAVAGATEESGTEGCGDDYARRIVRMGYVAIVPDWRAFGERYDRSLIRGRDPCNVCQNSASWLGYNLLALDVHDARVALDLLQALEVVDSSRLGMVGLSYGGRVTTFTAALDERIRVAVVSGALNLFVERISARGSCGSQVVPGLLRWGDIPEVLGLIAPRALFIERGKRDELLPEEYFTEGYERVKHVYESSGSPEALMKEEFDGGHQFQGGASLKWLARWLQE
jgi:dienelactone hydrolase